MLWDFELTGRQELMQLLALDPLLYEKAITDGHDRERIIRTFCDPPAECRPQLSETLALIQAMGRQEYSGLLCDNIAGRPFAPVNLCRATPADLAVLLWLNDRPVIVKLDARLHRDDADKIVCRAADNPFFWPFAGGESDYFRGYVDGALTRHKRNVTTGMSVFLRDGLHCFLLRRKENMPSAEKTGRRSFIGCDLLAFDPVRQVLHLIVEQNCPWKKLCYPIAFGDIFFGDINHFPLRRRYRLDRAATCEDCVPGGHPQIKSITLVAFAIVEYDGNGTEIVITARKNAGQILRMKFWPLGRNAVLKRLQFRVVFQDGAAKSYMVFPNRAAGNHPYDNYTLVFEEFMAMIGVLEVPDAAGGF